MGFYNKESRGRGGKAVDGEFDTLSDNQIAEIMARVDNEPALPIYWQRTNPKSGGSKSHYRYAVFMTAKTLIEYDNKQDSLLSDDTAKRRRIKPDFKGDLKDGLTRGFCIVGDDATAIYKSLECDVEGNDSES